VHLAGQPTMSALRSTVTARRLDARLGQPAAAFFLQLRQHEVDRAGIDAPANRTGATAPARRTAAPPGSPRRAAPEAGG